MYRKLDLSISHGDISGDDTSRALLVSSQLNKIILGSLDFEDVVQKIADTIPAQLRFATGVVAIIDHEKGTIKRVAASKTREAAEAIAALKVPFKNIEIPITFTDNLMARALSQKQSFVTDRVLDVLTPVLNELEANKIQKIMGTKTTFIFPIYGSGDNAIGVFLASTNKALNEVTQYERDMIQIFTDGVGIAIEHALLYSRLKKTSDQLADANRRLQSLDKLKDDFVSVASHELRTPMTAIKSYLWMALNKRKNELSPDLARYLQRSYVSVERLISLVGDMLNISRIESGRIALDLGEVDLEQLVSDVIEEILPKSNEKMVRVKSVKSHIPKVFCDADKIHEVLLNLIGNALKFTPNGGEVVVTFGQEPPFVVCKVSDTGRGIEAQDIAKLFTKFGRLENSYVAVAESGGTGLGLFITKSIINLHKGEVSVASGGLGKGSAFSFSLPIVGSQIARQLASEVAKEAEVTGGLEKTN